MLLRILLGLTAWGLASALAWWFATRTRQKFEKELRSELRVMEADGTLPPELRGLDLDYVPLSGFGLEVSRGDLWRIWIADLLRSLWWIWMPLLLVICLLVAILYGKSTA